MRLRGGMKELRIETGRYAITNRERRLEESERRCLICLSGEIEDETHFVLDCVVYEDLREKMFDVLRRTRKLNNLFTKHENPITTTKNNSNQLTTSTRQERKRKEGSG